MLFQHTWQWVVDKSPNTGQLKTQTRRIVKPGQEFVEGYYDAPLQFVYSSTRRCVYGRWHHSLYPNTYAVQPGRGKYAIYFRCLPDGKIQYWHKHNQGVPTFFSPDDEYKTYKSLRIRITDIRREDVRLISEADARAEGFKTPSDFLMTWCKMHDKALMLPIVPDYNTGRIEWHGMRGQLLERPAERYQAWALTFELVREVEK